MSFRSKTRGGDERSRDRTAARRVKGVALAGAAAILVAACGTTTSNTSSSASSSSASSASAVASASASSSSTAPLKIAFLYDAPVNDQGWDTAMYAGEQAIVKRFGSRVSVTTKIVPDGPEVKSVLTSLISQGYKMFFTTSFAEQTYSVPLAKANPDVKFIQTESATTLPNLGTYFTEDQDGFYVAGIAAAALSKSGTLGMVGGFPISDNLAETNGFALGAQSYNPKVKVRVVWTDNWDSVVDAQNAAQGLINSGADGIAFLTTGPAPAQVAQRNNVPWIGYQANQESAAPNQYLLGVVWNTVPYFVSQVQDVLNGTWKTNTYFLTMKGGGVVIDNGGAMYAKLPARATAKIEAAIKAFQSGTKEPFMGPVYDQSGKLQVPSGKVLTPADVATMNYLVRGVIGTVPKGA